MKILTGMIKEKKPIDAFHEYLFKINEGVEKFEIYCPNEPYRRRVYDMFNEQDRVIFLSTKNGNIIVEQPCTVSDAIKKKNQV